MLLINHNEFVKNNYFSFILKKKISRENTLGQIKTSRIGHRNVYLSYPIINVERMGLIKILFKNFLEKSINNI